MTDPLHGRTKRCRRCGETKPRDQFYRKDAKGKLKSACKACFNLAKQKQTDCVVCGVEIPAFPYGRKRPRLYCSSECMYTAHNAANRRFWPETRACRVCSTDFMAQHGNARYCSKVCKNLAMSLGIYGLRPADYRRMVDEQGGRCAICGGAPNGNGNRLAVDHDHASGAVRGLLCHGCNAGMGQLKDDPELLRAAADYLERHKGMRDGLEQRIHPIPLRPGI